MLSNVELVSRLVMAAALGSVISFEGERSSWAAGLRTHMLVCVGSALIMIVSAFGFTDVINNDHVVLDPSRIAAPQVVSGIGFLGAGSILLRGEIVRANHRQACVIGPAIGLAVGGGLYTASIAATVIILIILAGIKPLERRFINVKQRCALTMLVDRGSLSFHALHEALGPGSARQAVHRPAKRRFPELDEVRVELSRASAMEYRAICERLRRATTSESPRGHATMPPLENHRRTADAPRPPSWPLPFDLMPDSVVKNDANGMTRTLVARTPRVRLLPAPAPTLRETCPRRVIGATLRATERTLSQR